ncbi:MAG: glutamine-hydrolyzing GMP synthase, partial [Thermomicrobiales bacterium]
MQTEDRSTTIRPGTTDPSEGEVRTAEPPIAENAHLLEQASEADIAVDAVVVLDFGSQYSQLITRRVRECGVYCELVPHDAPWADIAALQPKGVILSGGPASVYEDGAPTLPEWVLAQELPVLGICYGMQLLALACGGIVVPADHREYGPASISIEDDSGPLFTGLPDQLDVWMSHGDHIAEPPLGFEILAKSANSPVAAMGRGRLVGLQFHPEVVHTPRGKELLQNFLVNICDCDTN